MQPSDYESITIQQFASWWLQNRPINIPADALFFPKGFVGVVLFRDGPFQVQQFIGMPGAQPPRHTHPNVDSVEYLIAGSVDFESAREEYYGGVSAVVLAGEEHGATVGPKGACFFSIQKWLNGVQPTSVEADWTGAPLDDDHATHILH